MTDSVWVCEDDNSREMSGSDSENGEAELLPCLPNAETDEESGNEFDDDLPGEIDVSGGHENPADSANGQADPLDSGTNLDVSLQDAEEWGTYDLNIPLLKGRRLMASL